VDKRVSYVKASKPKTKRNKRLFKRIKSSDEEFNLSHYSNYEKSEFFSENGRIACFGSRKTSFFRFLIGNLTLEFVYSNLSRGKTTQPDKNNKTSPKTQSVKNPQKPSQKPKKPKKNKKSQKPIPSKKSKNIQRILPAKNNKVSSKA